MIEIKNISKSFNQYIVLNDLSVKIPAGSIYGLIGPNGSGKSTLLQIISGCMDSDSGEALYDGKNVWENTEIKRKIFFVSDYPYFMPFMTMNKLKEFYKTFYTSFDDATYNKYLNVFNLSDHELIKNFSKGMKRQVMLVIALSIHPEYLFLDEAFDGLDPMMRLKFKQMINESIADDSMTVVISSHNVRELEDICDQFGIISDGSILTSGDIEDSKNKYHKVQIAFKEVKEQDDFKTLSILHFERTSKVITMVVEGDEEAIRNQLTSMNPLLLEIFPVHLEELFIYEMERKERIEHE